jgi:chromosome segregation ATPase
MPLGLWKSKWEIHREDVERYREAVERYREDTERYREEMREERARSDAEFRDLRSRSDALRADYNSEIEETRRFNRELLIRMEKTYANLRETLELVGDELGELKAAVNAQTRAILKLVDRFEDPEGRPPV